MREISEKNFEALNFIMANKHFFLAPLLDQEKFLKWSNSTPERLELVTCLSEKLAFSLLDKNGSLVQESTFKPWWENY